MLYLVTQSDFCDPMDCSLPGCSIHGDSEYWSVLPCSPSGDLPNPGVEPRSPTLQVDSLPSEPPGKPKNTGMGSLSLLQGIFLTQESRGSPALQADSLSSELLRKPTKTQHGTTDLKNSDLMIIESLLKTLRPYSV